MPGNGSSEGEEGEKSEPKAELTKQSHLRTVRPAAFPSYLCCRHVGRLHHLCEA